MTVILLRLTQFRSESVADCFTLFHVVFHDLLHRVLHVSLHALCVKMPVKNAVNEGVGQRDEVREVAAAC
jgi:hypothetical protein